MEFNEICEFHLAQVQGFVLHDVIELLSLAIVNLPLNHLETCILCVLMENIEDVLESVTSTPVKTSISSTLLIR